MVPPSPPAPDDADRAPDSSGPVRISVPEVRVSALLGLAMKVDRPVEWEPPTVDELRAALPQHGIQRFIGRGGMGAVYEGVQAALNRRVAIKILPPSLAEDEASRERFAREAESMARFSHAGLVAIHDAGRTAGGLEYFVMEFVDGIDLAARLRHEGRLPVREVVRIGRDVAAVLTALHAAGLVHRDIKPSNLLQTADGRVKVADFGLAKPADPGEGSLTRSDLQLGSPDYAAPETMAGRTGPPTAGADLYALGVTLFQLLTGRLPRGAWVPPSRSDPAVPTTVDKLFQRLLQPDPAARPQSADEVHRALRAIHERLTPPEATPPPPWRRPLVVVPVFAACALVPLVISLSERPEPPAPPVPHVDEPPARPLWKPGVWMSAMPPVGDRSELLPAPDGFFTAHSSEAWFPYRAKGRNFGIRAEFARWEKTTNPCLLLRDDGPGYSVRLSGGTEVVLECMTRPGGVSTHTRVAAEKLPTPVPEGQPFTLEASVVDRRFRVRVNGRLVLERDDATLAEGSFGVFRVRSVPFRNVELLNLDGLSPEEALKALTPRVNGGAIAKSTSFPPGQWTKVPLPPEELPVLETTPDGWHRLPGVKLLAPAHGRGRNCGVRVTFRGTARSPMPELILRDSSKENINAFLGPNDVPTIQRHQSEPEAAITLHTWDVPSLRRPDGSYTLQLAAIGDTVHLTVNGQTFSGPLPSGMSEGRAGIFQAGADAFRDFEVINLDGLTPAEARRTLGLPEEAE